MAGVRQSSCLLDVVREAVPRDTGLVPRHDAAKELVAEAIPPGEERRLPPLAADEEPLTAEPLLLVPLPEPRVLLLAAAAAAAATDAAAATPHRRRLSAADALLRAVEPAKPPLLAARPRQRAEPPHQGGTASAGGRRGVGGGLAPGRRAQEAAQPHRAMHRGARREIRGSERARPRIRACGGWWIENSGLSRDRRRNRTGGEEASVRGGRVARRAAASLRPATERPRPNARLAGLWVGGVLALEGCWLGRSCGDNGRWARSHRIWAVAGG
jgi:hypothetical protein